MHTPVVTSHVPPVMQSASDVQPPVVLPPLLMLLPLLVVLPPVLAPPPVPVVLLPHAVTAIMPIAATAALKNQFIFISESLLEPRRLP
jgi:hypothetical protein